MSDDLMKRLRGSCYLAFDDGTNDYTSAPDAADRIEELEAKLAKAVGALSYYANHDILLLYDDASFAKDTIATIK